MDVVTVEAGRHANESQAVSSPLPDTSSPNEEIINDIVTKVEIDEFDEYDGLPEIIRNQAKSKRARAEARLSVASASTDSDSNHSSASPTHQPAKSSKSKTSADEKYYKNMSRERRLIANARERTRVHTISTAFDALRQAIPTYSYNQKLSKLAILRIASAYIKSLSALTEEEPISDAGAAAESKTPFSACVSECTKTLQMECRARSRRKGRKE